jgi:hypothetical protein
MQTENESPAELSGVNESELPERPDSSEATTEQVLAEVERRLAEKQRASGQGQSRVVLLADRVVFWLSKHWLSVFNTVILLYVGLPVLAPILMFLNAKWPATIIYTIYRPLCHQLPQRSFFLFGPQLTYTAVELTERVGMPIGLDLATRAFVGNETLGYKMALCQRHIHLRRDAVLWIALRRPAPVVEGAATALVGLHWPGRGAIVIGWRIPVLVLYDAADMARWSNHAFRDHASAAGDHWLAVWAGNRVAGLSCGSGDDGRGARDAPAKVWLGVISSGWGGQDDS